MSCSLRAELYRVSLTEWLVSDSIYRILTMCKRDHIQGGSWIFPIVISGLVLYRRMLCSQGVASILNQCFIPTYINWNGPVCSTLIYELFLTQPFHCINIACPVDYTLLPSFFLFLSPLSLLLSVIAFLQRGRLWAGKSYKQQIGEKCSSKRLFCICYHLV